MKTKIIAILVFASLMTKLNAQNHDKVGLLEKPVPVSSVRNITGFFGHRMEVNRNAYLKHFPIDKYVDFVVNRQHSAWGLDTGRTAWKVDRISLSVSSSG